MPEGSTFNGKPNILPTEVLTTLSVGDPLDIERQCPLVIRRRSTVMANSHTGNDAPGFVPDSTSAGPSTDRDHWQESHLDNGGHRRLPVDSLRLDGSPRIEGEIEEHTRILAEAGATLPPILVHRQTMQVIDGMHRVRAALLKREATIEAVFFDGDAESAFVHAVRANTAHGLPLSRADRRAAVRKLLEYNPQWSDRAIAAVTGLSVTTIGTIRAEDEAVQTGVRRGRDGRVRPLDPAPGRRRAAQVVDARPDASLREIASLAGVSVATARDVRRRVRDGLDPVVSRKLPAPSRNGAAGNERQRRATAARRPHVATQPHKDPRLPSTIIADLRKDPSLRYSEHGRAILRWLDEHLVEARHRPSIVEHVPPHCAYTIAEFALACSAAWKDLAEHLLAHAESL